MLKNTSTSNSERPVSFLTALIICIILRFFDVFMPINTFTYRFWEALIVHKMNDSLPGPFYPNFQGQMIEQGDLAPYTHFAVKKMAQWETDRYGFRKRNTVEDSFPIVIVGDSAVLGTGLTQSDTLAEVLELKLKQSVYPYAPFYQMETFLNDPRFIKSAPKVVIFALTEWTLPEVLIQKKAIPKQHFYLRHFLRILLRPHIFEKIMIVRDRIAKLSLMRFLNARIRGAIKNYVNPPFYRKPVPEGILLFPGGKSKRPIYSQELADKIIPVIQHYEKELQKRNIAMLFIPIPYKETLYNDAVPGSENRYGFYNTIISGCQKENIPTIDLLTAFQAQKAKDSALLFQLDDSHWNSQGVEIAAREIARYLHENSKQLISSRNDVIPLRSPV